MFDAIIYLAMFEWFKNDRAAGGSLYFQDYYPTKQPLFALNHWWMQRKAAMICVVIRTTCALVMKER